VIQSFIKSISTPTRPQPKKPSKIYTVETRKRRGIRKTQNLKSGILNSERQAWFSKDGKT